MKIKNKQVNQVKYSSGGIRSSNVTFDEGNTQKLMYILTSSLYSNPIGSIVREYTSNCFDAHIEVNNTKDAVIVQISENEIRFVDFGIGLNEVEFENVFCKILRSTKEDTNSQIGAWGLGSKSAFSYTDSFTVKSTKEGVTRIWNLSKDKSNTIKADKIVENINSKERNGTVVTIPLRSPKDVVKFEKECRLQLMYFDNVYFDCEVDNNYKILIKDNFIISNKSYRSELHICLGKVAYPIDWEYIGKGRIALPIGLKFNIGEIDVTPSREGILWDEDSKRLVLEKIEKVKQEFEDEYNKDSKDVDDIILYLSELRVRPYITLNDVKINISNIGANVQKYKYSGKKELLYKNKDLFNGATYKNYDSDKVSIRRVGIDTLNDPNVPIKVYGFFHKLKHNHISHAIEEKIKTINSIHRSSHPISSIKMIQVNSEYVEELRPLIESKYGGYVCEKEIPSTSKFYRKSSSYTHKKDLLEPDQILCGKGKIYSGTNDELSFTKYNQDTDELKTFEGDWYYTTWDNRESVIFKFNGNSYTKNLVKLGVNFGFNIILSAKSNHKYFKENSNFKHISKIMTSKELKDMVKNYHIGKQISKLLPYTTYNNKYLEGIISKSEVKFLGEVLEKNTKLSKKITNNQFTKNMIITLDNMFKPSDSKRIYNLHKKLNHLENIRHLKDSQITHNHLSIVSDHKYRFNDLCSRKSKEMDKWEFFKEYHKLKMKCGK